MLMRSPFTLKNEKIKSARIECGIDRDHGDFAFHCSFSDCEITIVKPCDWIDFYYCTFENCHVVPRKESGINWNDCRWTHCTFVGDFVGSLGQHGMEGEPRANASKVAGLPADYQSIGNPAGISWAPANFLNAPVTEGREAE